MSPGPTHPLRLILGVAVALAIVAGAGLVLSGGDGSSSVRIAGLAAGTSSPRPVPAATLVTVGQRTVSRAIAPGFLGLSFEYPAIEAYAGADAKTPNTVFEQLIRNLFPGSTPAIRIGGDSTDLTWWPVARVPRPAGARYTLTRGWVNVTRALVAAVGAHLILGIDLEADSRQVASAEMRALTSGLGRQHLDALELGNEPELYGSFLWDGSGRTGRPRGYDFGTFLDDFSRIASALPKVRLAGPSIGGPRWLPYLSAFLAAEPRVAMMTLHRYPLKLCFVSPGAPEYPTIGNLLAARSSRGLAASVAPYVRLARARGRQLRVDEMNVNSCGHDVHVSGSFASALWALDVLFEMARVGVNGVNFHTYPGASYGLFNFHRRRGRWLGDVAPEYYGLLMFAQAVAPGSHLLFVHESRRLSAVEVWAVRAPDGRTNVVLINDGTRRRDIAVSLPLSTADASLELLRAPNLQAAHGVTIGGQSFARDTATGQLRGPTTTTPIKPVDKKYTVAVPPFSAALVTIP